MTVTHSTLPTVFVVHDDPAAGDALVQMLQANGLQAMHFHNAQEFLHGHQRRGPSCAVINARLPDMSGLELQEYLRMRGETLPLILLTAHENEVTIAVKALKGGAFDVRSLSSPDLELLERVRHALQKDEASRTQRIRQADLRARANNLTPLEMRAMDLLVHGMGAKQMAAELNISERSVVSLRARVLEKMQAGSVAELVRLAHEEPLRRERAG